MLEDDEDQECDEFTLFPEGTEINLFTEEKVVTFSFPTENDAIFFYELWNRYCDGEFVLEFQQNDS